MCSPETDMHPYFNTDRFKHGDTPSRVDEEKEQSVCLLSSSISVSECLLLCRTQHASYIHTYKHHLKVYPSCQDCVVIEITALEETIEILCEALMDLLIHPDPCDGHAGLGERLPVRELNT